MRPPVLRLAAVLCLVAAAAAFAAGPPVAASSPADIVLGPGDVAPPFSLPGSDGKTYTLADFRGVRPVVLAWFPRAFAKI